MYISNNTAFRWQDDDSTYALQVCRDDTPQNPREDQENLATMACWHSKYSLGDKVEEKTQEEFWRRLVRHNVPEDDIFKAAADGKLGGIRIAENKEKPGTYDIYETCYLTCYLAGLQTSKEAEEYLEHSEIERAYVPGYLLDDLTVGDCQTLLEPYAEWMSLWLYDHSGLTMSCGARTGQYDDRWDSGQVGWIILTKEQVMNEVGTEYVLDENGERIRVEHIHEGQPSTWSYMTRPLTDDTWRRRAVEIMEGEVKEYDQYLTGEVYGYILFRLVDDDWEKIDSCWGFFGSKLEENGMLDQVGCGFSEAFAENRLEEGTAQTVTVISYSTEFEF